MTRLTNEAVCYIQATDLKPHYYEMTPQEARVMRAVPTWQSGHTPHLASMEDRKIPMRDGQEINIRLYIPEHAKNLPVIIYYHGGGWVFGDLGSTDAGCQLLADKAHAIVVSVDYRLAPEYPFPIPLNDAYDGLLWVFDNIAASVVITPE
ncbi:alpha/beta hydrolase [Lysinibacillus sp. NPDC093712]|uniref:alpha/beta hydrolase n=1 Tax=Lysinibacillus sp. NPDC093712 TaxID=3390579 RepID=UPI003D019B92